MIEYPLRPGWQIRWRHAVILPTVHKPTNLVRPPFHGEDVKVVRVGSNRQRVGSADAVRAGISRTVKCAMRDGGLATDVLHDVDLAALRPTNRIDIPAKHPEGGPE